MLTDILNWTALVRFVVLIAATAIGAPNQRRRPVPIHCVRGQIARLTAQVAPVDPSRQTRSRQAGQEPRIP
jgi:hypothetical protein